MLSRVSHNQSFIYVLQLGIDDAKNATERRRIGTAACIITAYDSGLLRKPKGTQIEGWLKQIEPGIRGAGGGIVNICANLKMGRKCGTYANKIEEEHPGFLHKMWRAATKELGAEETWAELSKEMNKQSESAGAGTPILKMTEWKLRCWFKYSKGKVKKNHTRPILTDERKAKRVGWCNMRINEGHCRRRVFLDEKWFYLISKWKKAKYLPLGPGEIPGDDKMPTKRLVSRRYSPKVMFMGAIASPEPGFDGKIYMKRVSEPDRTKRQSYVEVFSDVNGINEQVKRNWRSCVNPVTSTASQMINSICSEYDIADVKPEGEEKPKKRRQMRRRQMKMNKIMGQQPSLGSCLQLDSVC